LLLSLHYLASEGISAASDDQGLLSLNGVSLPPIDSEFGGYRALDARGYQIMLEYPRLPHAFNNFTLAQLLNDDIPAAAIRDKIVLLGATASSLQDTRLLPNQLQRSGVEHHGYVVSQLLDTALQRKLPLRSLDDAWERLWLLSACVIGAITGFRRGSLARLSLLLVVESSALIMVSLGALEYGWWLPLGTPLSAWLTVLGASVIYFSNLERAKRRQLMQLFASHVSPEVAMKLWSMREQFFDEGGVRPDTLHATVVFTDLCNFTQTAESMEPLMLMQWLNEYMEEMSRLVQTHGGIVNKYIGDAVMAVFGVPVKREQAHQIAEDARHAVKCALAFDRCLRALNQQWQMRQLPTMTMRAGIFSGPLVAGSFGGSLRMEYTVIGDTVNIASRLESFDKTIARPTPEHPCRILVGESTYRLLGDEFQARLIGECILKGKSQVIKIYQILSDDVC
jgi:adenylate cyclase